MFSTTPATVCPVCRAMAPARSATSAAALCGVVTTRISAFGSSWATRNGHVTGARRQIQEQRIQVAEVHVGQELLQRAVQHRARARRPAGSR